MSESKQIPLAEYIFRRIASLGVRHVLGVPGDFNLHLLDHVYSVPELTWVGCCNELNAAYAADGYTRVRGLPAALVTTYGVGELSAMNGVAGAFAEHAGMIHIVGMTSRQAQKARPTLHHTLYPGMDQCLFADMSKPIRHTAALLNDESTFTQEVNRVIEECVKSRLPCYLFVPMDTPMLLVDATPLQKPLDTKVRNASTEVEDDLVKKVVSALSTRQNPVILAHLMCIRHGGQETIRELAELTRFPSFACPLSKGVIDEDKPYFNGIYNGKTSFPGIQQAVESSDLVLNVGPLVSDSNTGGFSRKILDENLIYLGHDRCEIFGEVSEGVHFLPVLRKLLKALKEQGQTFKPAAKRIEAPVLRTDTRGPIFQDFIWQRLGRFLQPNDIVITECGTAQFGMFDAVLPPNTSTITSVFWSSIGFAVGALLGACLAAKEMNRGGRVILIEGDGSLQMTVQEISTCIKYDMKPIIFIVNNDGYAIERAIHGAELSYNDINNQWDHQSLLSFFGAKNRSLSVKSENIEELEKILEDPKFKDGDYIRLCEMVLDKFDYPWRLATQIANLHGHPLEKKLDPASNKYVTYKA